MDKRRIWTQFGPLMVGILALLVFGLAPMASAGKAEDRAALRAERKAARAALRAERKAARAAEQAEEAQEQAEEAQEQAEEAQEPAGKPVASELIRGTTSAWIGSEGGSLKIHYKGGQGGQDDVRVQFIVPENALAVPKEITMALELDTQDLSHLTLIFAPSGLDFLVPAKLMIKMGKDVAKGLGYQSMVGLHISKDANTDGELVETVPLVITPSGKAIEVLMEVPGFSRYSLGGNF